MVSGYRNVNFYKKSDTEKVDLQNNTTLHNTLILGYKMNETKYSECASMMINCKSRRLVCGMSSISAS